jgi:hypothetical protein
MTKDEALTMCLEYIETNKHERKYVRHAIKAALEQQAEQIGWAVQGCSKMWRGEFAEIDAKAEAKRIGGTCVAFALYTEPPKCPWVGLTEFQFAEIYNKWNDTNGSTPWGLNQALEAKLRNLNK